MSIYFHHFHKCAGTSIVKSLNSTTNGFYEPNLNGNPVNKGKTLSLHDMSDESLEILCKNISLKKKCFAYEWGIPNLNIIKKYNKLVVVIREPVERLVSNYKYDLKIKATKSTFSSYISNIAIPYCRTDYYNYEISRRLNNYNSVNKIKDNAEWLYNEFDEIIILEKGKFRKIKNKNIVNLDLIPFTNKSKSIFSIIKKKQKIIINNEDFKEDLLFYSYLKNRDK